jgi:predicted amidophosphoribosyltransferase
MATVADLSAPYGNFMLAPHPGAGVCETCFNLTDGYERCYACEHGGNSIDVVAPVSYSIAGEQLHHALAAYKRSTASWTHALVGQLAAVLWRHLAGHESCLARRAGVERFPLVTVVPSGHRDRETPHPLRAVVAEIIVPTRDRYAPLLRRTEHPAPLHAFTPDRFAATGPLHGEPVLLIDDTWTTGASAQSAAATLKQAGAGAVAAVVIGRHLNRDWSDNDQRLRSLPTPFDWTRCAYCEPRDGSPANALISATRRPEPVASFPMRSPAPRPR